MNRSVSSDTSVYFLRCDSGQSHNTPNDGQGYRKEPATRHRSSEPETKEYSEAVYAAAHGEQRETNYLHQRASTGNADDGDDPTGEQCDAHTAAHGVGCNGRQRAGYLVAVDNSERTGDRQHGREHNGERAVHPR